MKIIVCYMELNILLSNSVLFSMYYNWLRGNCSEENSEGSQSYNTHCLEHHGWASGFLLEICSGQLDCHIVESRGGWSLQDSGGDSSISNLAEGGDGDQLVANLAKCLTSIGFLTTLEFMLVAFIGVKGLSNQTLGSAVATGTFDCEDLIAESLLDQSETAVCLLQWDNWSGGVIVVDVIFIKINNLNVKASSIGDWRKVRKTALSLDSVCAGLSNSKRDVESLRQAKSSTSKVKSGAGSAAARLSVRAHAEGKDGVSIVALWASPWDSGVLKSCSHAGIILAADSLLASEPCGGVASRDFAWNAIRVATADAGTAAEKSGVSNTRGISVEL